MENYYEILEVPTTATLEVIKRQYRKLLLRTHPDKTQNQPVSNNNQISHLQKAYQTLSDPVLKSKYDLELSLHFKKIGISHDGLDEYDLDEFEFVEDRFVRDCPRCTVQNGMILEEQALVDNQTGEDGSGEIIIQCAHCSLWIKVLYYDQGDDE